MLDKIKSKLIIKEIFKKIKSKRKLNIIKYNKRLLTKLNIDKKDFEICTILNQYNKKYGTNIEDINIKELNLSDSVIKNKGLKDLIVIGFKKLKELNLCHNDIKYKYIRKSKF